MHVLAIHVPIQGLLRTPKAPIQKSKMWLEIGALASQASKLPLPFGPGTTNLWICPLRMQMCALHVCNHKAKTLQLSATFNLTYMPIFMVLQQF